MLGLLGGAHFLGPLWPHDTELEFLLGADHGEVVELSVAYLDHGEELHGVNFRFPEGAPATVHHHLNLPSGELIVRCELRDRAGGMRQLTRKLRAPAAGVVRIALARSNGGGRS